MRVTLLTPSYHCIHGEEVSAGPRLQQVHAPVHAGGTVDVALAQRLQGADKPTRLYVAHNGLGVVDDSCLDGFGDGHFGFGSGDKDFAAVGLVEAKVEDLDEGKQADVPDDNSGLDGLGDSHILALGGVHDEAVLDDVLAGGLGQAAVLPLPGVNHKGRFFVNILAEDGFFKLQFLAFFVG